MQPTLASLVKSKDKTKSKQDRLSVITSESTQSLTSLKPSSPVEHGEMSDYINWHKEKSASILHHNFTIAHQILEDNTYDLQTIQQQKGVENQSVWKDLEIKPGIEIRLALDVSK